MIPPYEISTSSSISIEDAQSSSVPPPINTLLPIRMMLPSFSVTKVPSMRQSLPTKIELLFDRISTWPRSSLRGPQCVTLGPVAIRAVRTVTPPRLTTRRFNAPAKRQRSGGQIWRVSFFSSKALPSFQIDRCEPLWDVGPPSPAYMPYVQRAMPTGARTDDPHPAISLPADIPRWIPNECRCRQNRGSEPM